MFFNFISKVKAGANADNIVAIGYCFGGTGALEAARGGLNVVGVVSFHGGLGRDSKRELMPIKAKVLVLHGADDTYVPESEIKGVEYLGNGPYRVWKNRLKGNQFGVWNKTYNNTETGEAPWIYPEFKGYHSNFYGGQF